MKSHIKLPISFTHSASGLTWQWPFPRSLPRKEDEVGHCDVEASKVKYELGKFLKCKNFGGDEFKSCC